MLGDSREEIERWERARFLTKVFAGPWTSPEVRRHEGYARDRFHWLLGSETPPPPLPGIARRLEVLTWWVCRCFDGLQRQRRRLSAEAAS